MKAHCIKDGSFKGIIESEKIYEKLKNGDTDWTENVKGRLSSVTIPYDLFVRLMALDKAVEDTWNKAKEEYCGNCDSCDDTDCQNTPDEEATDDGQG